MLPQLRAWDHAPGPRSLDLVVISGGTNPSVFAIGLRSTVLLDPEFKLGPIFGANGTPMAVLIDPEGRVASGPVAGGEACLELLQGRHAAAADKIAEVV